jgi:hypothetical protein
MLAPAPPVRIPATDEEDQMRDVSTVGTPQAAPDGAAHRAAPAGPHRRPAPAGRAAAERLARAWVRGDPAAGPVPADLLQVEALGGPSWPPPPLCFTLGTACWPCPNPPSS